METDIQLLRRFADHRDENAFSELVRRRIALVYGVAWRRLNDRAAAEDAAQQVFSRVARQAKSLSRRPVLVGWLYRAAHGAAIDILRSETSRRRRETAVYAMDQMRSREPGREPAAFVPWDKARPLLDTAMADLVESERDAVLLRFFEQKGYPEIGILLGLSDNAARMKVSRAVDKLQRRLAKMGITSSLAAVEAALAESAPGELSPMLALHIAHAASAATAAGSGGTSLAATWIGAAILAAGFSFSAYFWLAGNRFAAELTAMHPNAMAAHSSMISSVVSAPKTAAVVPASIAGRSTSPKAASAWDAQAQGAKFLARHPEVKHALQEYALAMVRNRFAALFAQLQLDPQKQEALEQLLALEYWAAFPYGPAGETYSFSLLRLAGISRSQRTQELKDLLGPDGYLALRDFPVAASTDAIRSAVADMTFSDAPLSAIQAQQLLAVARTNDIRTGNGSPDWPALAIAAAPFLSASQQAAFADIARQQDLGRQASAIHD